MNIYFVFGASGSGKTAILDKLRVLCPDMDVHDFDDLGVPDNADKVWRQKSTEKWLAQSVSSKRDICICGGAVPGEIYACPAATSTDLTIKTCLLDCSDIVRIRRLKERGTYGPNQDIINWAAWLRIHSGFPSWEQRVISENCWEELILPKWLNADMWPDNYQPHLIDTTNMTIDEAALSVYEWINVY